MAPMSPVPAARSVSSRMRNFSPAVNVRRLGRFDNSGLAAAAAGTTSGLRPSSVPPPAAACASATLLGMTTRQFSYALKSKLLGGLCLIIIGTEGVGSVVVERRPLGHDAGRVDGLVAAVVVPLDMVQADRLLDAAGLVQVAQVVRQVRI